ncbi:hypothetical protein [Neobacillus sp. YIM B06451]|uniref:hypothetical protein n=1 Tax=Neobacillus sp. YIM B06451 TaxID=3070994 RepID=UPI00292F69BC|nr:hypothetical protein [Neobacillus sp. YIM B06451]
MSSELEGLLYFGVMGTVFLISLTFAIIRIKKSGNLIQTIAQFIGLSFLLHALACFWWFFQASDGFGQVFGGLYYGIAFVLGGLFNTVVVILMKKKINYK